MTALEDPERRPLLSASVNEGSGVNVDQEDARAPDGTKLEATQTPLPWRPVLTLLLLNAVQPLAYELVFPFVNQMLVELKIVDSPERVGFYSGLIESIFAVMSLLTIFPTSYASDRYGRKPVILWGITGLGFSLIFFGMSRTFLALVLSRCVGGGMGAVWAAVKVMLGELTDKSNQHIAFSGLIVGYRMGQIIGLPIGGYLAHPERQFPGLFGGQFWHDYPFALPCFVGAATAFFAVFCGLLLVKETLRRDEPHPKFLIHGDETGNIVPEVVDYSSPRSSADLDAPTSVSHRSIMTKGVVQTLIANFFMCFSSEILFTVFALFAFTPIESGGLSFPESRIGGYFALRAILQIAVISLYSILLRSPYVGRGSAVRMFKISMATWPITVVGFPILNLVARSKYGTHGWVWEGSMVIFLIVWGVSGLSWSAMGAISNDASPSAEALTKVASWVQLTTAVPQAISPALSSSALAISVEHQLLGGYLHWLIFFVITAGGSLHALTLQEPKHDWRVDAAQKRTRREAAVRQASATVVPTVAAATSQTS